MDDNDRTQMPPAGRLAQWAEADRQTAAARDALSSSTDSQALPAGSRLHEFEVLGLLGRGGFCMVYRAHDHSLQREVALKEYLPMGVAARQADGQVQAQSERHRAHFEAGLDSFVKEALTLARFDHPALVRVYRHFQAHGTAYMVMQLVQGTTLDAVARALPGPPDEAWLLRLLDPLTAALQAVHREQIVHRDIAPDNIMMLDGSLKPLLLDFGAARQVIADSSQAPTAILKPSYAPIEQFPDSGLQQGAWTDVFALAGVVHRLIVGSAPPNAQSRLIRETYQPLAQRAPGPYSQRFLQAIDRGLALRPDARTPSVAAFRQDLGLPSTDDAGPPRPAPAPAQARRRLPAWAAPALAGVVLVGGAAAYLLRSAPPAPTAEVRVDPPPEAPTPKPPETVPEPVARPVAPSAITPAQAFEQVLSTQTAGFGTRLSANLSTLRAKRDALQLQLSAAQDGYYTLLVHDTDGEVRILFPNASEPEHRIRAGQTVTLPARVTDAKTGLSQTRDLRFGEPAGPLRLLALVTPEPVDFKAATARMDGDYPLLHQGQRAADAQAAQPDRPLYLGRLACAPGPGCDARHGAAALTLQVTR